MSETLESYDLDGYTVRIVPDYDPMSPREADNATVMVCSHKNYTLGDSNATTDAVKEAIEAYEYHGKSLSWSLLVRYLRIFHGATTVQPLFLYEHGGITISTHTFPMDAQRWDTSMIGFIFDTTETRTVTGVDAEHMPAAVAAEVKEYATYLEGGYVGFVIEDAFGEHMDSCYGFATATDAKEIAASVVGTLDPADTRKAARIYREATSLLETLNELVPPTTVDYRIEDLKRSLVTLTVTDPGLKL